MSKILSLSFVIVGLLLVSVIGSEDIVIEESRAYKAKPLTDKVIEKVIKGVIPKQSTIIDLIFH